MDSYSPFLQPAPGGDDSGGGDSGGGSVSDCGNGRNNYGDVNNTHINLIFQNNFYTYLPRKTQVYIIMSIYIILLVHIMDTPVY